MKTIAIRLTDGQDLYQEIERLVTEHQIKGGVILSAVGGLRESTIRVPVIDGNVQYIHPQNVEIDCAHGTVATNGLHVHISVSDTDGKAMGGHLKPGCTIRTTCELVIGVLEEVTFSRQPDAHTGYDELVIENIEKDG